MLSITRLSRFALNVVLPPRCPSCDSLVQSAGALCGDCWRGLHFISKPYCERCGKPLPYAAAEETCIRAACLEQPFTLARSALAYNEISRQLLLRFKHGSGEWLAPRLGEWLWQAGRDLWPQADALVPIPLHWQRLSKRQYNQATLLAREVGQRAGVSVVATLLHRHKATIKQKQMSAAQRAENMAAAFAVSPEQAKRWQGKHLVLIDDVLTSGATLASAAHTLLQAGIGAVSVATVARVLRAET